MGRPLWDRVKLDDWKTKEEPTKVIQLAANKLVGGLSAEKEETFADEVSLGGVASILCRLGLRPHSWSPLACQSVADYMAVLEYMSFSPSERLLSTYSSDPVLTFGAARVWYQSATNGDVHVTLSKHILPQFCKLLDQGVIDTGDASGGELVSRILLLLVMDATGVVVSSSPQVLDTRQYAGAFHSFERFLSTLYGNNPLLVSDQHQRDVMSRNALHVNAKLTGWRDWRIGFSHFVPLAEMPDEETLWALLSRRAAGICPRSGEAIKLVIPIFSGTTVSMLFVHVNSRRGGDPAFPESALQWPSAMVSKEAFWQHDRQHVVRIYMGLRGAASRKPFYLADPSNPQKPAKASGVNASYVLCVEGLDGWQAAGVSSMVPVVSSGVAQELRELLGASWGRTGIVQEDLNQRGSSTDVCANVMEQVALDPFVTWPHNAKSS